MGKNKEHPHQTHKVHPKTTSNPNPFQAPTFVGYSFQGAGKYGAYEVFKYYYGEKLFPNSPKTIVYLGASATAEFIADLFLCPFEAIKVRMQTTLPPYANNLREGWSKVVAEEGIGGLYKGLYPLWCRQIPYTMVKFATFESAVAQVRYPPSSHYRLGTFQEKTPPTNNNVDLLNPRLPQRILQHAPTNRRLLPRRLHRRHRVRRRLPPGRRDGVETQRGPQSGRGRRPGYWQNLQEHRLHGLVERFAREDRHDWNFDRVPVVDL